MRTSRKYFRSVLRFFIRYSKGFWEKGRFTPLTIPKLSIETTNLCYSKCVFCANRVMKRSKEHLDMLLFKKAVDEMSTMSGDIIDFNTCIGEPLLDPYLLKRAQYIRRFPQFKSLGFVTTLQWLHLFDINEFLESGISWIAISATLSGREKYSEFFGVDKYDIFLNNLIKLIEENNKRENKINIFIDIKQTNESIFSVIDHADFKMINSMVGQDLVQNVKGRGEYCDDWHGSITLPNYLRKRPLYPRMFRPCRLLYNQLMLFSNGNIGACSCRDFEAYSELVFGNIKDNTLEEIWKGERLAQIRFNWLKRNNVPNICRSCRHYLY